MMSGHLLYKTSLVIFFLGVTFLALLRGQQQSMVFHLFNQTKGLSSQFNAHYKRDSQGFLWTSSRDGLNRFDGKTVKIYRPIFHGKNIEPNITSQIFEDRSSNIWFTSTSALHCITAANDSLLSWRIKEDIVKYYFAFHLERDSLIWLIADKTLFTFNIHTFQSQRHHAYDSYVAYALEDQQGNVSGLVRPLLASNSGFEILRYQHKNLIQRDSFFVRDTAITYLNIESDSSFWIPSSKGLIHFNPHVPKDYKVYKHQERNQNLDYKDAASWKERYLWLATVQNGLLLFDKKLSTFIRQDSLLFVENHFERINRINKILVDDDENLWLSIFGKGLLFTNLNQNKFEQLFTAEILENYTNNNVNAIVADIKGNIYTYSQTQGLYQFPTISGERKGTKIPLNEKIGGEFIRKIYGDINGKIWILTDSRILKWNPEYDTYQEILYNGDFFVSMTHISDGYLLIIDQTKAYLINDKKEITALDAKKNNSAIEGVYLPGEVFFDKESGLVFLSQGDNQLRIFEFSKKLIELPPINDLGIVNGINRSKRGDFIWMATTLGLYKYYPTSTKFEKISTSLNQLSVAFTNVIEDQYGTVWLSTYNGLLAYNPERGVVQKYSQSDGLYATQYNVNAGLMTKRGEILFGGDQGVSIIKPKHISINPAVPKIHLLDIIINDDLDNRVNNPLSFRSKKFPYSENTLTFQFTAIEFSHPSKNRFRFFLSGYDKDTIPGNQNGRIRYGNLPPGDYDLNVWAANADGLWTTKSEVYNIKIAPPWHQTWWARSTGLFLLLGFVYTYYRYRIQQIKKRETFKRKEAEFKQKVAETENALLRLQMNPHFIFNAMNSINGYILKKDRILASEYLVRFSKLMRMILDFSEEKFITLGEEIAFLNTYLQIEAIRCETPFDYQIIYSEELDLEDYILPPMVMQPFIENAIVHGLMGNGGKIDVQFIIKENSLICSVTDNGVGRHYNNSKKSERKQHKSKAITITRRRLELLSEVNDPHSRLKIYDLQNPTGTRVELYLPLF